MFLGCLLKESIIAFQSLDQTLGIVSLHTVSGGQQVHQRVHGIQTILGLFATLQSLLNGILDSLAVLILVLALDQFLEFSIEVNCRLFLGCGRFLLHLGGRCALLLLAIYDTSQRIAFCALGLHSGGLCGYARSLTTAVTGGCAALGKQLQIHGKENISHK